VTDAGEHVRGYESQPNDRDASGSSKTRVAIDQFDRARAWGGERPQISLTAAVLLAVGASLGTRIYLRRRATTRIRRLAWLLLTARSLRAAVPPARTTAPLGGVSGAAVLAAILIARARRARTRSRVELLTERLATLEADAAARLGSDRLRPRDVGIGVVVGAVLVGLMSRLFARQSS
jgi:hypothetical protein